MLRFLIKRFFYSILVIFGVSIVIFILARVIPGDPARLALGEMAPKEAVEELRIKMHLNDPIYTQYYYWFSDIIRGNFGISLNNRRLVLTDFKEYFPATLELIFLVGIFQLIFALTLGLMSARYRDQWVDNIIRVSSYMGIAVPSFVWAVFFILFFGYIWRVLPVINRLSMDVTPPTKITGMYIIDFLIAGNFTGALDAFYHALLPSLSIAIGNIFQEARILRSSLVDNMEKEFISVSNSFGIPQNRIVYRYLLKPSAIPLITIAGLDFGNTLGRAFIVETIFNWPGFSRYTLLAMLTKDLNAISAGILIISMIYIIVNTVVDVIIAGINPQGRLG